MSTAFSEEKAKVALAELSGWELSDGKNFIEKSFAFNDFLSAMEFMNKVAIVAEEMNHHPNWFNVYNRVDVALTTHSADGITQLDFDMAKSMDDIAGA